MYFSYQNHEELEDDLYQEDAGESEGSEANSELEFQLYSQLHYSSNAGELEEQESKGEKAEGQNNQQPEVTKKTADGDGEVGHTVEREPVSLDTSKLRQHLKKKKEKHVKQKKGEKSESESEESESKSESDSYDSSDSDGLESWMILGPAKQDGDQCISLNLEVGPDSIAGLSLFIFVYRLCWVRCALFRA
uniref:Uncharacterized protein n=1 Tax=Monopterus albus TaxID=43700 RepID=A0A3Q3J1K3_MONAL